MRTSFWLWTAALALAGSGAAAGKDFRVVTSFYPVYVQTLNVAWGVPGVAVENLTEPVTGCLHDFQLSPAHMRTLAEADVLVVNGLGMESFLDKAMQQRPDLKIITASETEGEKEAGGGKKVGGHDHGHDHAHGHDDDHDDDHGHGHGGAGHGHEGGVNPHVWVSVSGSIRQVERIAAGLAKAWPPGAEAFRANAAAYGKRLEALRGRMTAELAPFKGARIVTFHEAFPYFADEFGLEIAAVVQREPGSDPSARELAETIELIRKSGVRAVFAEPQFPARGAAAITAETGAKFGVLDPVVTGPGEAAAAKDAYVAAMEKNLAVLKQALQTGP